MKSTISHKEFIEFNRVFSLLLISKLPIDSALELITKQTKNESFKKILKNILKDINSGTTLTKSFAKYPQIFNDIYLANLTVAEETGNIANVLSEYTAYQEKFFELKKKILQAAKYPVFTLMVAVGVVVFMLFFLIPTFESLFANMKTEIPALTAVLLSISRVSLENIELLLFIFLLVSGGSYYLIKSSTFKRNVLDKLSITLPYFSNLIKKNILARFALSMSILLKSNVTLLDALTITKNISTNYYFELEINKIVKKLSKGESLSENIQRSAFFDYTFSKLLAAGEESAELDHVFLLISDYYTKEFDYDIESITTLIEPILILFIGTIIAVILIAMYLPMFEIVNYMGV